MKESKYFVWCPEAGAPTKAHETLSDAQKEAKRLCEMEHNKEFLILRAVEGYIYNPNPMTIKLYSRDG